MLDGPVVETVGDLIGRAAVAARHAEEFFHLADPEVGHAPGANLSLCLQTFKCRDNVGNADALLRQVQKVKIEMIGAETGKARLAGSCDAVARHVVGPNFGDQEHAIALAGDRAADEFLGAVNFRRVDDRHPEGNARTQRLLFFLLWTSSPCETRGALAKRRHGPAITKFDGPCRGWCVLSRCPERHCQYCGSGDERRCAEPREFAPVQGSIAHTFPDNAGTLRY